ncbi:MAG: hypothetical protein SGJ04_07425 [Bacteroidota bacterium]|nr:hypothetical protein [Bacteroidota bacterium]
MEEIIPKRWWAKLQRPAKKKWLTDGNKQLCNEILACKELIQRQEDELNATQREIASITKLLQETFGSAHQALGHKVVPVSAFDAKLKENFKQVVQRYSQT